MVMEERILARCPAHYTIDFLIIAMEKLTFTVGLSGGHHFSTVI